MAESLTTNLRLELEKTNLIFNRWVENQKEALENNEANYERVLEESDHTIRALKENDKTLEESRTLNENIKKQQKQALDDAVATNELLLKQKAVLEQDLRKAEENEEREAARLEKIRSEHEQLRAKMEQSLNDLTRGIHLYMALGLEFQKADGDCMKFVFTQIDPNDVSREFYFLMYVDANNMYQLVETSPTLNTAKCVEVMAALNATNNIGKFVASMRKLFCATVR